MTRRRVDNNHAAFVHALRACGLSVAKENE